MSVRVAVIGAAGRMGKTLIEAVHQADGLALTAAIVLPDSSLIGADAGELAGVGRLDVALVGTLADAKDDFDVLIDFTSPETTLENMAFCVEHGKKMVIGTTGLNHQQRALLQTGGEKTAIMFASNMSVGVNLCFKFL